MMTKMALESNGESMTFTKTAIRLMGVYIGGKLTPTM